jgi:RNA polymerase sigma-70 factor (ECF subfamily)
MKLFDRLCQNVGMRRRLEESRPHLYRVAYSWCHDSHLADDLAQEALTKALRVTHQLREPEALYAWLFRILNNCWQDYLRSRRDNLEFDENDFIHPSTPETLVSQQQKVQQVRTAIAQLSPNQRQVITLVDLEGFTYAEVADILELPIGTVMSRLCRARKLLVDLLVPLDSENLKHPGRIRRIK